MDQLTDRLIRYAGLDDQSPYLVAHWSGIPFNPRPDGLIRWSGKESERITRLPQQSLSEGVIAGWISESQ